jgi:hypothetical protein
MAFSANVPVYDVHAVCPCCIGPCCMNNWTCCMNTTRTLTLALALTHEHTNTRPKLGNRSDVAMRWSVKRFIASIFFFLPALNASSPYCFNFLP